MKDFVIYEHIYGLPSYVDTVNEELTECAVLDCYNEEDVERYVEKINEAQPKDKYGRERNLYVRWQD